VHPDAEQSLFRDSNSTVVLHSTAPVRNGPLQQRTGRPTSRSRFFVLASDSSTRAGDDGTQYSRAQSIFRSVLVVVFWAKTAKHNAYGCSSLREQAPSPRARPCHPGAATSHWRAHWLARLPPAGRRFPWSAASPRAYGRELSWTLCAMSIVTGSSGVRRQPLTLSAAGEKPSKAVEKKKYGGLLRFIDAESAKVSAILHTRLIKQTYALRSDRSQPSNSRQTKSTNLSRAQ
jgi:hypothetical protein